VTLRVKFCVIGTGGGGGMLAYRLAKAAMCWSSTQAVFQRNRNLKTS
jgi:ketopantoate reductase